MIFTHAALAFYTMREWGMPQQPMNYSDFQHLARLFTVGALDQDELEAFTTGRLLFGKRAEAYLRECRDLIAVLALGLDPMEPRPGAKALLMRSIHQQLSLRMKPRGGVATARDAIPLPEQPDPFEAPLSYKPSTRN